jgi:hypothetical protein
VDKEPILSNMLPLTDEQLKILQRVYPDKAPKPGTSMDLVWYEAGQAEVIRNLIQHANKNRGKT